MKQQNKVAEFSSRCKMNDFKSKSVPWLKEYLTNSGIQLSDQGRHTYLVGTEEYTAEDMKSFKSLHGYRLFSGGHVQDLRDVLCQR